MKNGLFLPTSVVGQYIFVDSSQMAGSSQQVGVPYFKHSLTGNDEFRLPGPGNIDRLYVPLNSEVFIDMDRFVKAKTR